MVIYHDAIYGKRYIKTSIAKEKLFVSSLCLLVSARQLSAQCMMTSSNGNISALLAIYARNSPVTGEFPAQRPVTWSFDVFFDLRLNKRLNNRVAGGLRRCRAHYDVTVVGHLFWIPYMFVGYMCGNVTRKNEIEEGRKLLVL